MAHHRTSHGFRMRLTVETDEGGNPVLIIPPEALKILGVEVGDEISLQACVDGGWLIRKLSKG